VSDLEFAVDLGGLTASALVFVVLRRRGAPPWFGYAFASSFVLIWTMSLVGRGVGPTLLVVALPLAVIYHAVGAQAPASRLMDGAFSAWASAVAVMACFRLLHCGGGHAGRGARRLP